MHKSTDLENLESECGSKFPPLPKSSAGGPRGHLISSKVMLDRVANCHRASIYSDQPEPDQHLPELPQAKYKQAKISVVSRLYIKRNPLLEQRSNSISLRLPLFKTSLLATVLEDMIAEMRIIVECNSSLRILLFCADLDLHITRKYGIEIAPDVEKFEKINENQLHCKEYKLHKLDADRNKILNVISNLYKELSKESTCDTLCNFIFNALDQEKYIVRLAEDQVRKTVLKKELSKKLRLQRNHQKSTMYDINAMGEYLKSQIEDEDIIKETKERYIDNWQAACAKQCMLNHHQEDSRCLKSTDYLKKRSEHEFRVHHEIESFTNQIIHETLVEIEQWMNKYDEEVEKIDLKIHKKRNEYLESFEKRSRMEQNFIRRGKEICSWVIYKKERKKAQEYGKTLAKSAIIVQAWWRGLLVRRKLGPFRIKKRKPGRGTEQKPKYF